MTVVLAHFTALATGSGLVPLLGTLLTVYSCEGDVLKYQPEARCGGYVHVLFIVVGTASILLLVPYALVSALLYFEATWSESSGAARRATGVVAFEQTLKAALLALSIAGPKSLCKSWVVNAVAVLGYCYVLAGSVKEGSLYFRVLADNVSL